MRVWKEASSRPIKRGHESRADGNKNTNKKITNEKTSINSNAKMQPSPAIQDTGGYESIPVLQNMNPIPSFVFRGTGRGHHSAPPRNKSK